MPLRHLLLAAALTPPVALAAEEADGPESHFTGADLFGLTVAADPQIHPSGKQIAYVRRTNDIMTDRALPSIWQVDVASGTETPLVTGKGRHSSPRWSPDGERLAYISTGSGGGPELHVRWMDSGLTGKITALPDGPSGIAWSPDGTRIAYTAMVPGDGLELGSPPPKPEGADWGEPLQITDRVTYRRDGGGYVKPGTRQLFVVSSTGGGAPRQLTFGPYDHGGAVDWAPDGKALYLDANRKEDWELQAFGSEIYRLDLASGELTELTTRDGLDTSPQVSPDGRQIAYLGFDDEGNAYDQTNLYVMNADGSDPRPIAVDLDRSIDAIEWTKAGLFASFDDDGKYRVAKIGLDGSVDRLEADIGSTYYPLPYTGGPWSVSPKGVLAFATASPLSPPDIGVADRKGTRTLTALNEVLLESKELGKTQALQVKAPDGTRIPSWIVLPPGHEPGTPVPMILEMHGGPYAAYGPEFSADYQLYAAAGYAVLFTNPGGSTGYGEAFADRIEDNYPISNFDELMAAVDVAVEKGYADPDNLYVTGGSGGGILTAWVVGKTDRFKAAASHKPVINWVNMALMSDGYAFFGKYWMGGQPWERHDHYWERSPLSIVHQVTTPTLMLVGAEDFRTPRSEAEQFYGALQVLGVDTALVVTPSSSHNNLSQTPSQQAARTASVIAWFDTYRKGKKAEEE